MAMHNSQCTMHNIYAQRSEGVPLPSLIHSLYYKQRVVQEAKGFKSETVSAELAEPGNHNS
jgi:hypothetical protein